MLTLRAGTVSVPAQIQRSGDKLAIFTPFSRYLVTRLKACEGAKWDTERRCWLIADSERNRIALAILSGNDPFAHYRTESPPVVPNRSGLFGHQKTMLNFALTRKRCILAAEQGTGKTLVAIDLMEKIGGEWWYVAPLRVLSAIKLELKKWGARVDPRLLSYDALKKLAYDESTVLPSGIIFDESSRLKNAQAERTKCAQHIADQVRARDGFIVLMSGTPAPRDPTDWWSQCEIACPGFLRESSVAKLRGQLAIFEEINVGRIIKKVVGWKGPELEDFRKRMSGLVQVHLAKDCLDLPELSYEILHTEADPELEAAARLVASTAGTAIEALTKLRQLSDGFIYAENSTERGKSAKDVLLQKCLDRAEETGRIIIYAGFHESVDHCQSLASESGWTVIKCDGRGWGNEQLLPEMDLQTRSEKDLVAFVGHPGSGGMGLNMTAAKNTVYFSNDFSGEARMQSEKRCHRSGQTRGVTITDLFNLKTDELVLRNLKNKRSLQAMTLEEIRESLHPGRA